jgi:CBS domain-containing protein
MKKVKALLQGKGQHVWSISSQESVLHALEVLSEKGVGALLVMDGGNLVGIISERDYARKIALRGKSSVDTKVADIMVEDVLYVTPEHTTEDCMSLMSNRRIRHLPVLDNGQVVGMLSIGDLVKNLLEEQKSTIEQLENYIRGN